MTDRIKALEDALRPFAEYYSMPDGPRGADADGNPLPDNLGVGWVYLTYGDFRRARAALAASPPAPDWHQPDLVTVQDAARVLLDDPDTVARLARAYDREDSAQRGEADPHDASMFPVDYEWLAERAACACAALRAIAEGRE